MKEIILTAGSGTTHILVGNNLSSIESYCRGNKPVVITTQKLAELYSAKLSGLDLLFVPEGEEAKSLEIAATLYHEFCARKLERGSFVVSFGGGVISDISGYVASTYLRGIKFGAVPTTLLAQVDASVGGKNGVNFEGYKNLIGTIRQAEFCLCDTSYLTTLPKQELSCGFAEIIKHGAINNSALFKYLEQERDSALALDSLCINHIVYESIKVKADIVQSDETEQGQRRLLNFGHTLGHGLEAYYHLPHGESVAIGMVLAAEISVRRGLLSPANLKRLTTLIERYNLPTTYPFKLDAIMEKIERDKKRVGDGILMVLLEGIGAARVEVVSLKEIKEMLGT
jgi:3-dehydroquinate synthase